MDVQDKGGKIVKALSTLALFLLILTASCSQSGNAKQERGAGAMEGDITIGATAPWARFETERMLWQGIEMALDEINNGGGVLGRKIRLIKEDDEGTVSKARIVAQKFADNPDVVAVLGHYNSHNSIATSVMYEYYKILMLSHTSTAPLLTSREGFTYIFRNVVTDDEIARRLAEFAKKRGYERLMIYYVNNDYGRGLANAFEAHASQLGSTTVDRLSYDSTEKARYFRKDLEYWKKNFTFDAIFLAGEVPKAGEIIAEARRLGIKAPILGGDGLDSPQLWEVGGDLVEGTIVGTYFHPDDPRPEAQAFTRAFSKRYGKRPDAAATQGYDALKVLAYAMQQAGTIAPGKVAETLRKTKNWKGATGPHTFNNHGDVVDKPIALQVVRNKKFELLK